MIHSITLLSRVCLLLSSILLKTSLFASTSSYTDTVQHQTILNLYVTLSGSSYEKAVQYYDTFHAWKGTHDIRYGTMEEEMSRWFLWIQNHEYIHTHNNQNPPPSYKLGHNIFSHLSNDEYKKLNQLGDYSSTTKLLFKRHTKKKLRTVLHDQMEPQAVSRSLVQSQASRNGVLLPKEKNWVEEGAVTNVKNQKFCGACWAFSATGAIEGAKFIYTGELVALSEQNLIDCDDRDRGCEGGLMESAFSFEESEEGLCSEIDYPYIGEDDICTKHCQPVAGSQVKSFFEIKEGDQHGLLASIALQPTSVAMEAQQIDFQFYKEGVFDNPECGESGDIDHGVLAVGYGIDKESGMKYWLIKNSWGDTWGEGGYVRIKRDMIHEFGQCAILRVMTAPIMM